jgi:hypothetical protein
MAEAAAAPGQEEKKEFVPTAEQLKPHGAFVTQVYASELGGFVTPQKERLYGDQHLKKTGVLLRYSWEIGEKEFRWKRRVAQHIEANPLGPKPQLRMPKEMARKQLVKMERTYAHRAINMKPTTPEFKSQTEDFRHMNGLRAILGLEEWDYRKEGVPQASKDVLKMFDELQEISEPDARLAAVRTIRHPDVLRLVMLNDGYTAIRETAERLYGEMVVGVGR